MTQNRHNLESALNLLDGCRDTVSSGKVASLARHFFGLVLQEGMLKPASQIVLTAEEIDAGKYQGKIPCIKLHRGRTGMGLKESKDAVEEYFHKNGWIFYEARF